MLPFAPIIREILLASKSSNVQLQGKKVNKTEEPPSVPFNPSASFSKKYDALKPYRNIDISTIQHEVPELAISSVNKDTSANPDICPESPDTEKISISFAKKMKAISSIEKALGKGNKQPSIQVPVMKAKSSRPAPTKPIPQLIPIEPSSPHPDLPNLPIFQSKTPPPQTILPIFPEQQSDPKPIFKVNLVPGEMPVIIGVGRTRHAKYHFPFQDHEIWI